MSAFLPKADMCSALADVCFGPKADIVRLFDHLVGARLHRRRHVNAECLGRREVEDQLKLGRLYNWQFRGVFTLKNPASINAGQTVTIQNVRSVAHQTASRRKISKLVNRRHGMANSQGSQLFDAANEHRAGTDHEPAHPQTFYVCEHRIKVTFAPNIENM